MSNYPLDKKMLEEEYGDLLIKAALREYAIGLGLGVVFAVVTARSRCPLPTTA